MRSLCIIADSLDTQYAGVLTYASMLIPALEAAKPKDVEITYLHQRPNAFFDGRRELLVPNLRRYPGSDTVRRMVRIPRLLRREGFSLVHDLGHMAPFPRAKEPYAKIVTVHDLTPLLMPHMHVRTSRVTHRHLFPRIIANCDHVITVSQTTCRDVEQMLMPACPVTAIPLAGKRLDYRGPRPHGTPYILCVSTLEPRKNIETLLAAFELLKDAGLPHDLVLIGKEGWHVEPLLARIKASRWANAVVRPGFVPDTELGAWYNNADVAVYPSLYEGFGLPVLEALGGGVPLVVSDIDASREVAGTAATFVPPTDASAMAGAILAYLQDPDLSRRMRQAGLIRAHEFSWAKTAERTWEVYLHHLQKD